MATTLEQQVALDEALVSSAQRLRIGRSNFRLPSDIQSKNPHYKSPRIPGQSFAELPFVEEILEFLRFLGHSTQSKTLTDPSIPRRNRVNWHYVRDDVLFSTIKVVSRHQTTQQYGAILPIELTTDDIRNIKAYKEYYACATGEAAPKPKASARKKKAEAAKVTDDDDNEEEVPKTDEQEATESDDEATESHREREDKETREQEEESFDPIPRTPEESVDDDNNEEDQGLRIGEKERMQE
nr:hypothetical protein [Tanacetum cinerariifolium]